MGAKNTTTDCKVQTQFAIFTVVIIYYSKSKIQRIVNYFRNWSSRSQQNDDHAKSKFKEAKTRVMLSWPPITWDYEKWVSKLHYSRKWTCSIFQLERPSRQVNSNLLGTIKIRRGPKLEGYAFANFGYSSETDGESHHEMGNSFWVSFF